MHLGQQPPGLPVGSAVPQSGQVPGELMAIFYKRYFDKTLLASF